jgi:hypothetical protein
MALRNAQIPPSAAILELTVAADLSAHANSRSLTQKRA